MLLRKKGFPEMGELLLCRVTNIQYNSVFVNLEEYENKSGMIHISEVSAGRIKNIREFVAEGKFVVCKVLNINQERGYIDLSLRRVSGGQHRTKMDELKQEQRAEKLIEQLCKQQKKKMEDVYLQVSEALLKHFQYIYQAFDQVVAADIDLAQFDVPKAIAEPLKAIIKENIKPKEVLLKGTLTLETYESDGIALVRHALDLAEKANPAVTITYAGGGNYHITVKASEFKEAEKILKESTEVAIAVVEKVKGKAEFKREETA